MRADIRSAAVGALIGAAVGALSVAIGVEQYWGDVFWVDALEGLTIGRVLAAGFSGGVALWFLAGLQRAMGDGEGFRVESHWGGLGGGVGGWRVSPAVVYLIGALSFGGLTALALLGPAESGAAEDLVGSAFGGAGIEELSR